MTAVVQLTGIAKIYRLGKVEVPALRGITVEIAGGEFVAIMGPSGSGKSTLMNIIGCLDRPTSGTYILNGHDVGRMTDDDLADVRNREIGFVFQTFNLLPRLNALKNVEMPMIYAGLPPSQRRERALSALQRVGLGGRIHHTAPELSGGEQQRVAIARALANRPAILLADEPTGNLDSRSGEEILAIFQELNAAGMTIAMVSHDREIAEHAGRILNLRDGRLVRDETVPEPLQARQSLAATGSGSAT